MLSKFVAEIACRGPKPKQDESEDEDEKATIGPKLPDQVLVLFNYQIPNASLFVFIRNIYNM